MFEHLWLVARVRKHACWWMGDVHILVAWIGKYKEGLSSLLFLRHVSHFGYSLPFHFLEDFRQVKVRHCLDLMGTGFVGD